MVVAATLNTPPAAYWRVMTVQTYDVAAIANACAASDPARGADGLLPGLGDLWPDVAFSTVLTRGGWYRSGGIVDIEKNRVADSLRLWTEQQATDDVQRLLDACLRTQLFATRLVGRTHYLTARTGAAAADFLQLEVEELQEVLDRYLSDPDWLPESLEEFIDPLDYPRLEPEPVGISRLVFRRFFSAREMINPLAVTPTNGLLRFMRDWDRSTAGRSGHFCDHWVLGVQESSGSDGEARVSAHPVSTCAAERPPAIPGASGAALANWIHGYDHEAGYPMAWYFHMVASAGVPHTVGMQIAHDHDHGFSYLPQRDLELVRSWMDSPYRA